MHRPRLAKGIVTTLFKGVACAAALAAGVPASDASAWDAFDRAVHLLVDEGTLLKLDIVRTKRSGD